MASNIILASLLAVAVTASVRMSNPVPYPEAGAVAPLFPSGSNFPCGNNGGSYTFDSNSNVYQQGSYQELTFAGNSGKGGGSCQVSITTDLNPSQSSDWRVIKSIIGGCPDLDGGAYGFQIPQQLPSGKYSLAWTWFNNLGNQEMYMNCAPMTVLGSGGSPGFINTLPKMLVANLGMTSCYIPSGTSVVFSDPGADVDTFNVGTDTFSRAVNCLSASNLGTTISPPVPATENRAPLRLVPMSTIPEAPAPLNSTLPVEIPPPRNSTSDIAPSTAFGAGTPCADEGHWNCIEGTAFQRCAGGVWSAVTVMPAGVECVAGRAPELQFTAARGGETTLRRAVRNTPV